MSQEAEIDDTSPFFISGKGYQILVPPFKGLSDALTNHTVAELQNKHLNSFFKAANSTPLV